MIIYFKNPPKYLYNILEVVKIDTQDEFIESNINIAYKIFWEYYPKIQYLVEFDDAFSICLEGLVKAYHKYDVNKGFTFSTFAYKVIRNHLFMYVRKIKNNKITTVSLDSDVNEANGEATFESFIADDYNIEEEYEAKYTKELLLKFIEELPEHYKVIIRFQLQGATQKEIADKVNRSQAQVSRDLVKAVNMLRDKFKKKGMM